MTAPVFDLMINAEVIVDDVTVAQRVFVDSLGFPEPRESWSRTTAGFGFTYLFARVHPSMKVSPTRIEAMAVAPLYPSIDPLQTISFLPALLAAQGDRPWKTHGNELATSQMIAVASRLEQHGCPFHTMPSIDGGPSTRLWVGWTDDDPGAYRPDADGGLLLEICETDALMQGPALWDPVPDEVLPPGSMVRVHQRSWIVPDLDATLSALRRNFDLHPRVGPEPDTSRGVRRAVYEFAHPRSAALEVLEPIAAGEIRDSLEAWGPGAWTIQIEVNNIGAKADDLRRRGTAFEVLSGAHTGQVLRVDTGTMDVPGLFEFVSRS